MQNGLKEDTGAGRQPDGLLVLRTLAMPKDSNPNGDIFGGWILSQMDIGGGLLAKEVARSRTVTVTVDKMTFVRPVSVGDTICVYARVARIGARFSSITALRLANSSEAAPSTSTNRSMTSRISS